MTKAGNQWWTLYVLSCVCNNDKELFVVAIFSFLGKVEFFFVSLRVASCQLQISSLVACFAFAAVKKV